MTRQSYKECKKETTIPKVTNIEEPVAIVGAGPAGLFCAITLIENGVKPIIVEQGKKVEEKWPLTRVKLFFTHPTGDSSGSNVKT